MNTVSTTAGDVRVNETVSVNGYTFKVKRVRWIAGIGVILADATGIEHLFGFKDNVEVIVP